MRIPTVTRCVLLTAAFGCTAAAHGQEPDPRIDAIFATYDSAGSPGCAVGVYRDGGIAFARGYGMADLEHAVAITPTTMFDLGSTSKQFTAAAILLLEQEGRLSLEDDVRRHVPELPDYGRPITIRQLLNHTSGLRDYIGLLTLSGARIDDVTSVEDALHAIARQRELNFEPGTEFLYSNSGYFLLSVIVERASSTSLRDFARTRIFDPLGMRQTHYLRSYDDVVPRRASAYAPRPGAAGSSGTPREWRLDVSRWLQTGDGAVFSSIEELLLWDRNYYQPAVGGADLLSALHTRGVLSAGDTVPYALGLMLGNYRGEPAVRHGGSWGGYRAELLRFTGQRTSVAVLCNGGPATNASALASRVADVVLEERFTQPRPTPPAPAPTPPSAEGARPVLTAAQLAPFAGRYYSAELEAHFTLALDGDTLRLHRRNAAAVPLTVEPEDTFAAGSLRLRFRREGERVSGFLLDAGRIRNLRFERSDP